MATDSEAPTSNGKGEASTSIANSTGALNIVGSRVREERLRQKIGVREPARRVGVSASLISQVELGKASPSKERLRDRQRARPVVGRALLPAALRPPRAAWAGASGPAEADARPQPPEPAGGERVADPGHAQAEHWDARPATRAVEPVVRRGAGKVIQLATGVQWERLAPPTPQDVDFLEVSYQPGSESCPPDSLMRHSGHEYGHIISGRMGVTIGFDTYELGPGDSVAFDSTMPHRLFAIGDETVEAIWVVVGRRGDLRLGHGP